MCACTEIEPVTASALADPQTAERFAQAVRTLGLTATGGVDEALAPSSGRGVDGNASVVDAKRGSADSSAAADSPGAGSDGKDFAIRLDVLNSTFTGDAAAAWLRNAVDGNWSGGLGR
jgi:hypothetical protein